MIYRGFKRIKWHSATRGVGWAGTCAFRPQVPDLPAFGTGLRLPARRASCATYRRSPAESRKFGMPNVRDSDSRVRYFDSNRVESGRIWIGIPILRPFPFGIPILRRSPVEIRDVEKPRQDSCESTKNSGFRTLAGCRNRGRRIPGGVNSSKIRYSEWIRAGYSE